MASPSSLKLVRFVIYGPVDNPRVEAREEYRQVLLTTNIPNVKLPQHADKAWKRIVEFAKYNLKMFEGTPYGRPESELVPVLESAGWREAEQLVGEEKLKMAFIKAVDGAYGTNYSALNDTNKAFKEALKKAVNVLFSVRLAASRFFQPVQLFPGVNKMISRAEWYASAPWAIAISTRSDTVKYIANGKKTTVNVKELVSKYTTVQMCKRARRSGECERFEQVKLNAYGGKAHEVLVGANNYPLFVVLSYSRKPTRSTRTGRRLTGYCWSEGPNGYVPTLAPGCFTLRLMLGGMLRYMNYSQRLHGTYVNSPPVMITLLKLETGRRPSARSTLELDLSSKQLIQSSAPSTPSVHSEASEGGIELQPVEEEEGEEGAALDLSGLQL